MEEKRIAKESWTDLTENSLDTFSTTAAGVISDVVAYPLLATQANLLTSKANNYHISLSRYVQLGGTANRDQKDYDKNALFKAHGEASLKLEETADGDENYMTRPGYKIAQTGGTPHTSMIPKPTFQKAIN